MRRKIITVMTMVIMMLLLCPVYSRATEVMEESFADTEAVYKKHQEDIVIEDGTQMQTVSTSTVLASGTCGENLTWVLDEEGILTIDGTGEMTDWTGYGMVDWCDYTDSIISVVISDGITMIGNYAFYQCTNLVSASIPDSVTSINYDSFGYCSSLTNVTLPDQLINIDDYAFEYCSSLSNVTIADSVTTIGDRAFRACTSLTEITVSAQNANYSSVNGVLFNKDQTELIQYPGGKTGAYTIPSSVVTIESFAFGYGDSVTSVIMPDSVTTLNNYAFYKCTSIENVTISDNITKIGNDVFGYCSSLTSVVVPEGVTSIGNYAFERCTSMLNVTISNSVTTIGDYAFNNCTSLMDVYYTGSKSEWEDIDVGSNNSYLTDAFIHYNSTISTKISKCTITLSATSFTYDGAAKQPTVTVKDGSVTLSSGTDYVVSYSDNVNAGTATVTITGYGNYTGSDTKNFTITKANQDMVAVISLSSLKVGETSVISAQAKGALSYSSSATKVAKVSNTGVVTGVAAGTAVITVKAASTANYNAVSRTFSVKVAMEEAKIISIANTSTGIKLKWNKVIGAKGYYVYRKTEGTSKKKIATCSGVSSLNYMDKKAKNGVKYTYYVYPYDASITGSCTASKTCVRVAAVEITKLKNSGAKKMLVKWKKNSVATGYQIWFSTTKKFSANTKKASITGAGMVKQTFKNMKIKKTYYVKIRAFRVVDGTTYYSAWSSTKKLKITK